MLCRVGWAAFTACAALGAGFAVGCGGGSNGTGGSTSTTSETSTGGTGTTGTGSNTGGSSTTTSSSSTGTGGTGAMGGPFTSKGTSSYEAQTSIAASTKGAVVASWIGFFSDNTSAIGYVVSRDSGATWTMPKYVSAPGGRLSSNPVVAADGQGRFYLAWLGFRVATPSDEHVYLSKLDEATETFPAPVVASDDGAATTRDFDKPAIAVDANDNVLLSWSDFTNPATPVLTFARSADGATFTRSTIAGGAGFGNLGYLCLDATSGPSAPIYLVHLAVGATLSLEKSTDEGKTWQSSAVPAVDVVFQNPTCAVHGNDVWVGYASGMAAPSPSFNAPGDAVFVARSPSGGGSFDTPVSVTGAPGTQLYLFPQLIAAPNGKLELVYYEGVDAMPAKLTRATSADGATWTRAPLADPGTFTLDRTIASWLGDYLGLASAGGSSFVSFTENTENKAHIGFKKVAAP